MSIRIMGGTLKGRNIKTPSAFTAELRPTSSRVRESLFNILSGQVEGKKALDLFAGMACLGIEALSRGADSVVFVEKDFRNGKLISQNLKDLELENKSQVILGTLPKALGQIQGVFDLVFIDPPYEKNLEIEVLEALKRTNLINDQTLIIVEQSKHSDMLWPAGYEVSRTHRVGDTILCFLHPKISEKE